MSARQNTQARTKREGSKRGFQVEIETEINSTKASFQDDEKAPGIDPRNETNEQGSRVDGRTGKPTDDVGLSAKLGRLGRDKGLATDQVIRWACDRRQIETPPCLDILLQAVHFEDQAPQSQGPHPRLGFAAVQHDHDDMDPAYDDVDAEGELELDGGGGGGMTLVSPGGLEGLGLAPPPSSASLAAGAGVGKRYRPAPAKTFQCRGFGECRMVFSRSEHLARHIRKHTGERPFTCHCSKQFSRLDNLRQHAQTVHADKAAQNEAMMRELTSLHASMTAGGAPSTGGSNTSNANGDSNTNGSGGTSPTAAMPKRAAAKRARASASGNANATNTSTTSTTSTSPTGNNTSSPTSPTHANGQDAAVKREPDEESVVVQRPRSGDEHGVPRGRTYGGWIGDGMGARSGGGDVWENGGGRTHTHTRRTPPRPRPGAGRVPFGGPTRPPSTAPASPFLAPRTRTATPTHTAVEVGSPFEGFFFPFFFVIHSFLAALPFPCFRSFIVLSVPCSCLERATCRPPLASWPVGRGWPASHLLAGVVSRGRAVGRRVFRRVGALLGVLVVSSCILLTGSLLFLPLFLSLVVPSHSSFGPARLRFPFWDKTPIPFDFFLLLRSTIPGLGVHGGRVLRILHHRYRPAFLVSFSFHFYPPLCILALKSTCTDSSPLSSHPFARRSPPALTPSPPVPSANGNANGLSPNRISTGSAFPAGGPFSSTNRPFSSGNGAFSAANDGPIFAFSTPNPGPAFPANGAAPFSSSSGSRPSTGNGARLPPLSAVVSAAAFRPSSGHGLPAPGSSGSILYQTHSPFGGPPRATGKWDAWSVRPGTAPGKLATAAAAVADDSPFSFHPPEPPAASAFGFGGNPRKRAFGGPDGPYGAHPDDDGSGGGGAEYGSDSRPASRRLSVMELCNDDAAERPTSAVGVSALRGGSAEREREQQRPTTTNGLVSRASALVLHDRDQQRGEHEPRQHAGEQHVAADRVAAGASRSRAGSVRGGRSRAGSVRGRDAAAPGGAAAGGARAGTGGRGDGGVPGAAAGAGGAFFSSPAAGAGAGAAHRGGALSSAADAAAPSAAAVSRPVRAPASPGARDEHGGPDGARHGHHGGLPSAPALSAYGRLSLSPPAARSGLAGAGLPGDSAAYHHIEAGPPTGLLEADSPASPYSLGYPPPPTPLGYHPYAATPSAAGGYTGASGATTPVPQHDAGVRYAPGGRAEVREFTGAGHGPGSAGYEYEHEHGHRVGGGRGGGMRV
ncbi:hypothetical protein FB451DRAFT_1377239 [Mycena latifolia]|nr:hypothetical protein FB451DRAFT_1377239 [Mycena latifolia]